MRNDLTTAEVENKKLNNTVNLMEKNMSTINLKQMMKESIEQKILNN